MDRIRLSFCIPTYNFGRFIGATLESIVSQAPEDVEVVVVDGASTDDTADVVRGFQRRFERLAYRVSPPNQGVDRDLAAAVQAAGGDYCWLMSADDVVRPGAVARILAELDEARDVYLCNRVLCDSALRPIRVQPWLQRDVESATFDLSDAGQRARYFECARSLGALFSFISTIVVRRDAWMDVAGGDNMFGTNYAHVWRILAIGGGPSVKYLRDALVLCRGDNDSFLARGRVRRFLIDLDGYLRIADTLFPGDARARAQLFAVMRREHKWYKWVRVRGEVASERDWSDIERRLRVFGYGHGAIAFARFAGGRRWLVAAARTIWEIGKRIRRALARHAND